MSEIARRAAAALGEVLPALMMNSEDAATRQSETTSQRRFFDGLTHERFRVEAHETTLAPHASPHAPHRHGHEELIIVTDGALEVDMEGEETKVVRAGGLIFAASNRMHGWKNIGDTPASYFVVAIGND